MKPDSLYDISTCTAQIGETCLSLVWVTVSSMYIVHVMSIPIDVKPTDTDWEYTN